MPGVDGLIRWEGNGETLRRVLRNLSEFLEYVNRWYQEWKGGGFTFVIRLDIVGRCSYYLAFLMDGG
jgi:P2-related tail formation protein